MAYLIKLLSALYDNSSVLCYVGGRSPVKVTNPEGEEKTVTIAQALVDVTGQRFNINDLGVWLHDSEGGRALVFSDGNCGDSLGGYDLNNSARFVGVSAGGAKEDVPRSGNAPEKKVVVPSLEQVLAVTKDLVAPVNAGQLRERLGKLYQN